MMISTNKCNSVKWSLLFLLLISVRVLAQPPDTSWLKTYGGTGSDGGRTIIQTSDQGYLIAGWTWSFGSGRNDVFLVKTTSLGDTLWTKAFGSPFSDSYASALQTSGTNYIVAYTRGLTTGNADIGLVKIDSIGDTVWTKSYGSMTVDGCYDLEQTIDSGFVLVGWTYSGLGGADVYVIKTDSTGDTLWTRTYGGPEDDYGYSIEPTDDHGYIIAGYTNSFGGGDYDIYIIKTDADGDTVWTSVLGGDADDFGYAVRETPASDYMIAGATWSFGYGTPVNSNVYLSKYNASGDTSWTRTFGGSENDGAYSIQHTIDNNFVIAGYTNSYGAGSFDIYTLKIDPYGDTLWTTTYGAASYDYGFSIIQNNDSSYTIVGSTLSYGAGDYDVLLIKTEPDLNILERKYSEKRLGDLNIKPNPFVHKADIHWSTNIDRPQITIYDVTGRIVKKFSHPVNQTANQISWYGDDGQGNTLPGGVYIVVLTRSGSTKTSAVTFIR
jgi:hypothetical protein